MMCPCERTRIVCLADYPRPDNNHGQQQTRPVDAIGRGNEQHQDRPCRAGAHAQSRRRTQSLLSPQPTHSGRSLTSPDHYLRTQPPPTSKPETSKPKTSKPAAVSDQGLQDQVNADSVGSIRIALSQAAPRSPPPCQQLPTHPKRPATPTAPLWTRHASPPAHTPHTAAAPS